MRDEYFGQVVVDPYRWMETDGKALDSFLIGQQRYARAVLDRVPGRAALRDRLVQLDGVYTRVSRVWRAGDRVFFQKIAVGDDVAKLWVREGDGRERVLVDPAERASAGRHVSLDWVSPSPGGGLVAFGTSESSSQESVMEILDVASGARLGDRMDRMRFGMAAWLDEKAFAYSRVPELKAGAPPSQRFTGMVVRLHRLGDDPAVDPVIFGQGVGGVEAASSAIAFVTFTPHSRWAVGMVIPGTTQEIVLYVAAVESLVRGAPSWHRIVDFADGVVDFNVHGDDIYLLAQKDAPRRRILRMSLAHPDLARAEVVVPQGTSILATIGGAKDALYWREIGAPTSRIRRLPWGGKEAEGVDSPYEGSVHPIADDDHEGVVFSIDAWTKPSSWWLYTPAQGTRDAGLVPPSGLDLSDLESEEVEVASTDGARVPLSIIRRRDAPRDGRRPAVLEGYGSYGFREEPEFSPRLVAWVERGGVYAIAHVRGGGERGEDWHAAGAKSNKQHTFDDFVACAQYLVTAGYTTPAHLAASGTSAGGITVGMAITQHPEMFRAAVINVGAVNMLRLELTEGGPANVAEFGTVTTPEGFRGLYAMDAYQHVRDGVAYPAVLLTTGTHDHRVPPWQMAKMAARLQRASSSGRPVLLRVDGDAGHGTDSRAGLAEKYADVFAFLLSQLE